MQSFRFIGLLQLIGAVGLVLVYIGGMIVSGTLIRRGVRQGALLTLVGFVLLLFDSLCTWFYNAVIFPRLAQSSMPVALILLGGLNTLISMVGLILVIIGIWRLGTRLPGITDVYRQDRAPVGQEPRIDPALEPEPQSRSSVIGRGAQAYPLPDDNEEVR
jgi:hypothetical protein